MFEFLRVETSSGAWYWWPTAGNLPDISCLAVLLLAGRRSVPLDHARWRSRDHAHHGRVRKILVETCTSLALSSPNSKEMSFNASSRPEETAGQPVAGHEKRWCVVSTVIAGKRCRHSTKALLRAARNSEFADRLPICSRITKMAKRSRLKPLCGLGRE